MEVGIFLPTCGPNATAESVPAIAEAGERWGYDSVWTADHVILPVEINTPYPYAPVYPFKGESVYMEAATALTYIAGRTRRIKLAFGACILPYREPVLHAKVLSTLDVLSGGRVILGAGVGWMREEFEALHMRFEDRGRRADEHIQVLRALWTQEDPAFEGEFYHVRGIRFAPRPVRGTIPILIGGHSRPARRRASRLGDGWHTAYLPLDQLKAGWDEIRQVAQAAGRDPNALQLTCRIAAGPPFGMGGAARPELPVEQLREALRRHEEMGVAHVILDFGIARYPAQEILRLMEQTAKEVLGRHPGKP